MKNSIKSFLKVIAILFLPLPLISQVDTNFYQYRNYFYQGQYGIQDTNEASIITQFKKYEYLKGSKFSPTGSLKFASEQYHDWISDYEQNGDGTTTLTSDWESVGPHNTPEGVFSAKGVGRLICITLDPDNPGDTIYVGSPFGGAWKTYDGGQNWSNLNTDFLPVTKCSDIAINPDDNTMIFMATGDRDDYHNASISAGVYRSTDAGTTWQPVNNGLDLSGFYQISKILINHSNPDVVYLSTSRGIYKTTNATTNCTWVQLTDPLVYNQYFRNIIYKPDGLYSTIYASGKDIIQSTNGGASWASMTGTGTGLDFSTFTNYPYPHRINLTVSPAAPNKLFAYGAFSDTPDQINNESDVKCLVFVFDGNQWSIKDFLPGNFEGGYNYTEDAAGPSWMPIAVSPVNADHIYIGNVISWRTFDGGTNWEKTYSYSSIAHADCHDLLFSPDGQTLYLATDGGFSKITNPGSSGNLIIVRLNNGLTIGTITKLALTYKEEEFTLIGEIDCGSNKYDPVNLSPNPWQIVKGGDGGEQDINLEHSDTIYCSSQKNAIKVYKYRGDTLWGGLSIPTGENSVFIPDYTLNPINQDEIYANFKELYKKQHPGSWTQISDLATDFNYYNGSPLTALCIAPNNDEYIYVAVESYQYQAPSEFLLFKTTSGGYDNGCTTACWTEMFPPNPEYISSIAVSPYNENKIWIAYKGYSENNKIKHFDGNSWVDYSNGLPPLPVNNIIFNYGSDNGLFVATDNGVYYRDATMNQWETFKENLPNVNVSELEINYGFNKVVAGTFGRGLWESPLPCTLGDSIFSLENNQTWKVPMIIDRELVVGAGKTLTVESNATIHFLPDAKIIIKPGGKLILNGGTLTNSCGDLWGGIEVWGDPESTQIPANQGWLSISNGGTIENAVVAVRVGSADYSDMGGGIVHTDEAILRNNRSGVIYHDYAGSNIGNFNLTIFETTAELVDSSLPDEHMRLLGVEDILINGCTFRNTRDGNTPYSQRGTGILSMDASYYVDQICISGTTPCTQYQETVFDSLNYGLKAFAISTTLAPSIENSQFTKNYRGAYLSGITQARVTSNSFYLNGTAASESYGLYLDGCDQYWVENNHFEKSSAQSTQTGIGIYVSESGNQANEIYLNSFDSVEYSVIALGNNRYDLRPVIGLQIRCNDYNNTLFDEVVVYDGIVAPPTDDGIAYRQGANTTNAEDMAGNLFYYNTTVANDYDDINNQSNSFYYYYSNDAGSNNVEPLDYTQSTVFKEPKPIFGWTYEDGCPSGLTSGGGGSTEESRSAMAEAQADILSTEAVLTALVDGGDTETLNAEVESSIPAEAAMVYNELMAKSPNLSETVVESSIEKEDVLPNTMIRDVMVANPHTSTSLQLLEKLDNRSNPMPEYMKAQILAGRSIQSLKAELEGQLAVHHIRKTKAINRIARHFAALPASTAKTDSLLALYQADNSISSSYMQAWLYLHSGQYLQGQNVMTAIPVDFTLNGDELSEYQNMQLLFTMLSELFEAGKQLDELSATQKGQLQSLASQTTGFAPVYARNVLIAIDEMEYEEPVTLPDQFKSATVEQAYAKLLNSPQPKMLEVYPNPSKDFVILGYQFDMETKGSIEIRDVSGSLIQSVPFKGTQDQLTLTTRSWTPGMYMISLVVNKKVIETTKFTLIN